MDELDFSAPKPAQAGQPSKPVAPSAPDILYDPNLNYKRVRGKFFDWDDDPAPVARSTSTVDTPVQDGDIPEE